MKLDFKKNETLFCEKNKKMKLYFWKKQKQKMKLYLKKNDSSENMNKKRTLAPELYCARWRYGATRQ